MRNLLYAVHEFRQYAWRHSIVYLQLFPISNSKNEKKKLNIFQWNQTLMLFNKTQVLWPTWQCVTFFILFLFFYCRFCFKSCLLHCFLFSMIWIELRNLFRIFIKRYRFINSNIFLFFSFSFFIISFFKQTSYVIDLLCSEYVIIIAQINCLRKVCL